MSLELTLRKGVVIRKLGRGAYFAKDLLNENEILVTLSGKQNSNGFSFEIGEVIYIVVSTLDIKRGRVFTPTNINMKEIDCKGGLFLDKEKLDKGIDPLAPL